MSLNGLDDAKVKEAYEAALAEPGRWYVLFYIIVLLTRLVDWMRTCDFEFRLSL
jgi:hypothetical protein